LDDYIAALNAVIGRHDILRTAIIWEGLPEPVQTVWRDAPMKVEELELDPRGGDIPEQLRKRFDQYHLDICKAPLLRLYIAFDPEFDRWIVMQLLHHLSGDHTALEVLQEEVRAHMAGQASTLPKALPFRDFVAQVRLGVSRDEHKAFFGQMLGDVDEPTAPFDLLDVQGDGADVADASFRLDGSLSQELRSRARELSVSPASIFHVAWALVVGRASGKQDPVFGTVLFGRTYGGEGTFRGVGLFINTLPIRIPLGEIGVEDSILETHKQLVDLLKHEHASLSLAQRCSRVQPPAPLFTALLNYRHFNVGPQKGENLDESAFSDVRLLASQARNNYPITLLVDDFGQEFTLTARAMSPLDPQRLCAMVKQALEQLMKALAVAPRKLLGRLDILPPEERHKLLVEWNETEADYPRDRCTHQLFEDQVVRDPNATAVVYEDESLSYGELNVQANRLAHRLIALGVKPDSRVAICVERSLEMVMGLLAILKAGGCYVPLDPTYPSERLRYMLEDSAPVLVLTHTAARSKLEAALALSKSIDQSHSIPIIDLDTDKRDWAIQPDSNPDPKTIDLTSKNLAYVIYTSGSTGQPKGVMVEHRNLTNYLAWVDKSFYQPTDAGSPAIHSVGFDGLITTLYGPLIAGQRVVLPTDGSEIESLCTAPESFYGLVKVTPSHLRLWNRALGVSETASTKALMIGGEALIPSDIAFWQRQFPNVRLINHFGPTETTVGCATFEITCDARCLTSIPIGRPISNTRIYLLDGLGNPVPEGVAGEIYIGGAGVARGYLNRPELTRERFIESSFVKGDRLYKTGDLGRYLPDGNIEFLGRNDFQVKIRGFRIELGEIETKLSSHPDVREAVVLAREDVAGEKRLVGYYTLASESDPGAEELRSYLSSDLPEYMVPAAYVCLEALPLTVNGKLDRKALPAPDEHAYSRNVYEPPVGPVETKLAEIWSEVLGVQRVGRHDNFFELGGHSLLGVQVISRVRALLHVEAKMTALFSAPCLKDFCEVVDTLGWLCQKPGIVSTEGTEEGFTGYNRPGLADS
jgi:amino acid adenylation domain-containing protein